MEALNQLLKALNKRPIFETSELKEDLKPHIPYLTKDPETFQKLLQEIKKSQTLEQLKDLLIDADYDNPDSDLVDIFKNSRNQGVSRFQSGEELVNSVGK